MASAHAIYMREWRKKNRQKANESARRWRRSHPEAARAAKRRMYRKDREANAKQWSARWAVYRALRAGILARPDHCEKCGKKCKPEAHHPDYSKWLEVMFVCRACHLAEHGGRYA